MSVCGNFFLKQSAKSAHTHAALDIFLWKSAHVRKSYVIAILSRVLSDIFDFTEIEAGHFWKFPEIFSKKSDGANKNREI